MNPVPSDRSAPTWAVRCALASFGLDDTALAQIAGTPGRDWLQQLWDTEGAAAFYAHPYQVVRQEWYHMAFPNAHPREAFLAELQPTARILDYGCGTAEWLRRDWIDQGRAIDLVDQAGPLLSYLAAKYPAFAGWRLPTTDWQAPSGCYDAVVCLDVLEHVPQPLQLLARLWDVLKPGGVMALWFDPSYPHPGHLEASIAQRPAYWRWLRRHADVLYNDRLTLVRKPKHVWGFLRKKHQ